MRGIDVPWPSLRNVSLDLTRAVHSEMLPTEIGAYVRIMHFFAGLMVNTYTTAQADPVFPDDDVRLARVARCGVREWKKIKTTAMRDCELRPDGWHVAGDVVRFTRSTARNPIPMAVKAAALLRDGRRCVYCGDEVGPFHFDHLFPVARGGSDTASNVVVACAACNLSKSDRTLLEWVAALRNGVE